MKFLLKNYIDLESLFQALIDVMGPTVSFNLLRPDGSWFGYREVEKLASLSGIQLRVRLEKTFARNTFYSYHLRA